jgi:hypothetical protein
LRYFLIIVGKNYIFERQNTKSLGLDQLYISDFSGVGLCEGKLLLG